MADILLEANNVYRLIHSIESRSLKLRQIFRNIEPFRQWYRNELKKIDIFSTLFRVDFDDQIFLFT